MVSKTTSDRSPFELRILRIAHAWSKRRELILVSLIGGALTILMSGTFLILIQERSIEPLLRPTSMTAVLSVFLAICIVGIAVLALRYLAAQRARNVVEGEKIEFDRYLDGNEPASLAELDDLLNGQDVYFRLQLAIALREKARHFPIRIDDIREIKTALEINDGQTNREPDPQVNHLTKIIELLERGYAGN